MFTGHLNPNKHSHEKPCSTQLTGISSTPSPCQVRTSTNMPSIATNASSGSYSKSEHTWSDPFYHDTLRFVNARIFAAFWIQKLTIRCTAEGMKINRLDSLRYLIRGGWRGVTTTAILGLSSGRPDGRTVLWFVKTLNLRVHIVLKFAKVRTQLCRS